MAKSEEKKKKRHLEEQQTFDGFSGVWGLFIFGWTVESP